MIIAFVSEKIY